MTPKETALLWLGGLVGAVVTSLYNVATDRAVRWRKRIARFRRERAGFDGSISAKLVKYYGSRGLSSNLYVPTLVGAGNEIALLHDATVVVPTTIGFRHDDFLVCDHVFSSLRVNRSAI